MKIDEIKTLKELFEYSTNEYPENIAFSSTTGESLSYEESRYLVSKISSILSKYNISYGEKVGIFSQNMINWPIAFFCCVTEGRIAVPILPDFSEAEVTNIINHSESKALFISKKLIGKLTPETMGKIDLIIELDSMEIIKSPQDVQTSSIDQNIEKYKNIEIPENHIASIVYTSGTTGSSKGVMLSHKNLISHLHAMRELRPSFEWDIWLSLLPLSHTLETSLGFLLASSAGASTCFIDKPPTPSILLKALKEVRPTTILSVPLIIEKIYKNSILPQFTKSSLVKSIYETKIGRKLLHRIAGKKLKETFGGRLRFFGIGGAKLDGVVERFLYEAKFPYGIGYGLTETSPLLAGAAPADVKWQTTGKSIKNVQIKINNPDPITGEGEIVAKGPNIMLGYYKNPEATKEAFTEDGWFRTKDLGVLDSEGILSIRGRLSNMILGASGENIYPEEIETVINSHADVSESLVKEIKGKLVAMVHFNQEKLESLKVASEEMAKAYQEKKLELIANYESKLEEFKSGYNGKKEEFKIVYNKKRKEYFDSYTAQREEMTKSYYKHKDETIKLFNDKVEQLKEDVYNYVNSKVNKFSKVSSVIEQPIQFEKTATHKIKRYLYK